MGSRLVITDPDDSFNDGKSNASTVRNVKKIVGLLFGSWGIIMVALGLIAFAVLKGDVIFADFTGGLVTGLGDFFSQTMGDAIGYLISLVIAGIVMMGPMHYYAEWNRVTILIVLLITFFLTGAVLGRMFKRPGWAFLSGFVVMASFMITVISLLSSIDYIASSSFGITTSISEMLYSVIEGMFGMNIETLSFYTILENGAFLGAFSMLWASLWAFVFSPKKKSSEFDIGLDCSDGNICQI